MNPPFQVGITRDLLDETSGRPMADIGLELLTEASHVEWEFLAADVDELTSDLIAGYDALFVERPRVSARSLSGVERLALVARFGVGYDTVDVAACSSRGVLVTIQPDAVRRPVAMTALTLLLAVAHNVVLLDRLTRKGRWNDRRLQLGLGLTGRTIGGLGLGSIGRDVFKLVEPFAMRRIAHDPYVDQRSAARAGAELVSLETLFRESDFLVITCPFTDETRHLVDEEMLELMKPTACLINIARGPIVDQRALARKLREGRIRAAGLDVLEQEPVEPDDPILELDNVTLTPHWLAWTDECLLDCGLSVCRSILEVASGRIPRDVVNPEALSNPRLTAKLRRYGSRPTGREPSSE